MHDCPFCSYRTIDSYRILLHVETNHSDLEHSPFTIKDDESLSLAVALQHEEEEEASREQNEQLSSDPVIPSLQKQNSFIESPGRDGAVIDYVECPHIDCGEYLHLLDYNDHLDIHASLDDTSSSSTIATMLGSDSGYETAPRRSLAPERYMEPRHARHNTSHNVEARKQEATLARTISPFNRTPSIEKDKKASHSKLSAQEQNTRLGKSELGPFAYEERMPNWLYDQLKRGAPVKHVNKIGKEGQLVRESFVENEVSGLVPLLAQLSTISSTVEKAYFCHPSVQHCYKRRYHGGFCGYLNIQMQISYIQGARAQGREIFGKQIPSILDLQDMIEAAWDQGISSLGRLQTGGVRNTRKWIGTPEAAAIYESLGINHQSDTFHRTKDRSAHHKVYDFVESYFDHDKTATGKIRSTNRAPIYFQQPGHSLTIVGLERYKDGSRSLLVFDPGFGPSREIQSLIGKRNLKGRVHGRDAEKLMRTYRRTSYQLRKYDSFEILTLLAPSPSLPI